MKRHARADNRRGANRYPVERPVEFEGRSGLSRDISATGVLFTTRDASISVGEHGQCNVALESPGESLGFDAHVVRVGGHGDDFAVAVHFDAVRSELPDLD